jgi:hypothetical protein
VTVSGPKKAEPSLTGESQDPEVKFHEAGWDSFCTGYCFIRMAHIFAHVTCGRYVQRNRLGHSSVVLVCMIRDQKKQSSVHVKWLSAVMFISIFCSFCYTCACMV